MFSLVFQIGLRTAIPVERARRKLSIDIAVGGPIIKFNKKTRYGSDLAAPPSPIGVPRTGIIFISEFTPITGIISIGETRNKFRKV